MPQAQAQELEELNRELRQCNLQQFIQQTGAAPGTQVRVVPRKAGLGGRGRGPAGLGGGGQFPADLLSPQDLMPPARGQPLPGAPRSPALVPSLSPEGMSVCLTLGGMGSSCGPPTPSACVLSTVSPVRQNWR